MSNGIYFAFTNVYYILELKSNLLSPGQLIEKNLTITFKEGVCRVFHQDRDLIMRSFMKSNRLFTIMGEIVAKPKNKCLQMTFAEEFHLWHRRYGHLSNKGLETLQKGRMVKGLPDLIPSPITCVECLKGKQHKISLPKQSI